MGEVLKGRISVEIYVWCGSCSRWTRVESKTKVRAANEARGKGWIQTRAHGWLCPECIEEYMASRRTKDA